jgi:hypothetical protein
MKRQQVLPLRYADMLGAFWVLVAMESDLKGMCEILEEAI